MATVGVWANVHAERAALASDLEDLDDARWVVPSLCAHWSVRDVLAHMTATAKVTTATFFPKLAAAGFSLTRMQAGDIARERGGSPAETLSRFQAVVGSSKHPPGPSNTWLGETIIHGEDIRRPLRIAHAYPTDAVVQLADFYRGSNLVIGAKRRAAGLALTATDADWAAGAGPEVSGPILSIVMAIAGRAVATDDLSGDGVAALRSRC